MIVIYTQDEVYIEKCVMSIIIVLLIRKKTSKRRTGGALVDLTGQYWISFIRKPRNGVTRDLCQDFGNNLRNFVPIPSCGDNL